MINELNDSLDDLIGRPSGDVRVAPVRAPADYQPRAFDEVCSKCRGTGNYRNFGRCFACKGVGKFTFKTSAETRAKAKDQRDNRKANVVTEALSAFETEQPQVWAWIKANAGKFDFASKMVEAIARFGNLTDNQLAACVRCMDREAARTAERAERAQQAPTVDTAGVDRLKLAFDTAITYSRSKGRGLKMPRITIGGTVISPAGANSKNPGALYVKAQGEYLGKIVDGRFFAVSSCTADQQARVLAFIADPKAAAEAYGIETGTCCICNATLTNKESIERGIGPICGTKFGW